jgi:hypothetical protein
MNISPEIVNAFKLAGAEHGNYSKLAVAIGVTPATIYNWMGGVSNKISDCTWQSKVMPVLKPYLKTAKPSNDQVFETVLNKIDHQIRNASMAIKSMNDGINELKKLRELIQG